MLILMSEILLMIVIVLGTMTVGYILIELIKLIKERRKHGKHKRTNTGTD